MVLACTALLSIGGAYAQRSIFGQYVTPPELPKQLDFAGEEVPLENFDTRESLLRELLIIQNAHSGTQFTLLNTKRYFALIEPILQRNNVPEDFKYLCVAESSLLQEAASGAGAAGLWQIMRGTAGDFRLEVGSEVDERYHIEKATQVACEFLLKAYSRFGSWTLAAAAYNLGIDGVAKRIARQGVDSYYDAYMPMQTLRYLFRILAWKAIVEDPVSFGYHIRERDYYPPLTDYVEVQVSDSPAEWPEVAARHGTTYKMLRLLNPWIRDYSYRNSNRKTFTVKVPGPGFRHTSVKPKGK